MQNELAQLISETQAIVQIRPASIEKDYYITQILHALSDIKHEYFSLIFQGGTCLAKAHKIVKRMSEDCDFRIAPFASAQSLSKQSLRNNMRDFRNNIISSLKTLGFNIQPENIKVGNLGQFMQIELFYDAIHPLSSTLRPHILLEFIMIDARTEPTNLPVTTIIKEVLGKNVNHSIKSISCVSVVETTAEKWVALLRRVSNIERGDQHDNTLIRHLYDLYKISEHLIPDDQFFSLINQTIQNDRERYKNQSLAYYHDPISEIKNALQSLQNNTLWQQDWQYFMEAMVFYTEQVEFTEALDSFIKLSNIILEKILPIFTDK